MPVTIGMPFCFVGLCAPRISLRAVVLRALRVFRVDRLLVRVPPDRFVVVLLPDELFRGIPQVSHYGPVTDVRRPRI